MRLMLLTVCILMSPALALADDDAVALFDGKSLDGWKAHLVDDGKLAEVWSVDDGLLVCKGKPFGYLYTDGEYEDYKLTIEWRWAPGTEGGNSGVLLRIADEPESFLCKCVEAQLKSGSAGDLWAFYGATIEGDEERTKEIKANPMLGDFVGVGRMKGTENEVGEWNSYEIVVDGDAVSLSINGTKVNEATGLDVLAGPIGLQSEGAEIHFRKIELVPLDD